MAETARVVAGLKDVDLPTFAVATTRNVLALFGKMPALAEIQSP